MEIEWVICSLCFSKEYVSIHDNFKTQTWGGYKTGVERAHGFSEKIEKQTYKFTDALNARI
jgi:hypothetical protein